MVLLSEPEQTRRKGTPDHETGVAQPEIRIFDTGANHTVRDIRYPGEFGSAQKAVASLDGKRAFVMNGHKIYVWTNLDGDKIAEIDPAHEVYGADVLATDSDGRHLAIVSGEGNRLRIEIWDVDSRSKIASKEIELENEVHSLEIEPHFVPDSSRLIIKISESFDREVALYFDWTSAQIVRLDAPDRGKIIIGATASKVLILPSTELQRKGHEDTRLFDTRTGALIGKLSGPEAINDAWLSPDDSRVVTNSNEHFQIWDAVKGGLLESFEGLKGDNVHSVAFSPAGKAVAIGFSSGAVRIWTGVAGAPLQQPVSGSATSGMRVRSLASLMDGIQAMAFSPDGLKLAYFDRNGVRVWDIPTGDAIASLALNNIGEINFSPDGRYLAMRDYSTWTVRPMFAATGDLIKLARARVPRCLSETERQDYFLDPEPPAWCVEMAKWPYQTPKWRDWLSSKRANPN
jgi:WD40 repeat protein